MPPSVSNIDPSRTVTLRRAFEAAFIRKINQLQQELRKLLVDDDAFGLVRPLTINERFYFTTKPQQLEAFRRWLANKTDSIFYNKNSPTAATDWWEEYIRQGFEKGILRSYDDTIGKGIPPLTSGNTRKGAKLEFQRSSMSNPTILETLKTLGGRVLTELDGITSNLSKRIMRDLTDGLVQGKNPREIAQDIINSTNMDKNRAVTIARTEIIRAHAEGQLAAFEAMGVEEIGVQVEWTATQDARVCPKCAELNGVVLPIEKAHNLIPRHPNCRCCFIPANLGESTKGQKHGKLADRKLANSIAMDGENSTWAGTDLL